MGWSVATRDSFLTSQTGTTLFFALLTTNPSDESGTGLVEVSTAVWTNYARPSVTATTGWSAVNGGTASPQNQSNAAILGFGTATISGTAPVVTGIAIYTAATGGTFKGWAPLASSQTINNGATVQFPISALVLQA